MIYRFSDYEIDTARFELRREGTAQKIEPQVFEILRYLVERHGQFVGKDELHRAIWQGRVVSEAAMSSRIKAARRAIGDSGDNQHCIRTVHGRGFSFVAPVATLEQSLSAHEAPAKTVKPALSTPGDADAGRSAVLLSADVHLNELLNGNGPVSAAERDFLSERAVLRTEIEKAGGQVLATTGSGITARFDSAVAALECAANLQRSRSPAKGGAGSEASRWPRIGICELSDGPQQAMSIAARLQCWAAPGDICITGQVDDQARKAIDFSRRPLEASQGNELNELGLYVVEPSDPASSPRNSGIPQLQCGYPAQPREPAVVLLPFEALGNDVQASELAEGLRIDIQNALTKIARITLIAAASANAFRGKSPEVAAQSLGVRYVLHGTIQVVKQQARVFVELIDALSSHAIWAEQFNIALTDAFTIQDEITRKVVAALDIKLYSGEQARIWHQALTDPKTVRVFYRGVRQFFRMEREGMVEARRAFEAIADMRPESSIGTTWTALCHWVDYMRRWTASRDESKALAKRWAEKASVLEDVDGQAHTVLAHVRLLDREFDAALEAGRQALAIRPGCANANGFFGNVLHYFGEQGDAVTHLRKGIRLQPVYPPFFASVLGAAYLASGQAGTAFAVAKEALRLNAGDLQSRLVLAAASEITGDHELARMFTREILQLESKFSMEAYSSDQPYRHRETIEPMAAACRAAKLPA